ncbi:MAG: DNA-3-methyladenine glycosylase 2 family protein [Brachymonas sp.]|nr:DNA-3-methyladenine glycosylase 2 family protein [Brachymonas sp.]
MPLEISLVDALPSDDACYLALKSRDARFDGRFFTGVTSTGIYCRPVCRVKTPRQSNCKFFAQAAQAEAGGFRPCLRCRPELAPRQAQPQWSTEDASHTLAHQAAALLQSVVTHSDDHAGSSGAQIAQVAAKLGISERHLGRIMQAQFGISPLQMVQTHRLLAAKSLLTDTLLPMHQVAASSGFGSLRAFNAAFVQHYRLPPSKLRKAVRHSSGKSNEKVIDQRMSDAPLSVAQQTAAAAQGEIALQLGFRPPYDRLALLGFWQQRQLDTMECIALRAHSMPARGSKGFKNAPFDVIRSLSLPHAGKLLRGWLHCTIDAEQHLLRVRASDTLAPALPLLVARLRCGL